MKQYALKWNELPELGEVRELIDRDRKVVGLGVVYGVLPKEHAYLIRELKLDEEGRVISENKNV
jgi:hypothetical protein